MQNLPPSPQGAGAEALDLITALALQAMAEGGARQVSALRLIALLSAHYNWAEDHLSVGQTEMAALWSVEVRTAKRELARLIGAGYLEVLRPGVRGRVALYRLVRAAICNLGAPLLAQVSPEVAQRLLARRPAASNIVHIAFPQHPRRSQHPWQATHHHLSLENPSLYNRWFRDLTAPPVETEGHLHITAPNAQIASYVASRLLPQIERAVQMGYGRRLQLSFGVAERDEAPVRP